MFDAVIQFRKNEAPVPVIMCFRGENEFLSNFYPAEVTYKKRVYSCTESSYFAWRTMSDDFRIKLQDMTGSEAKKFSKTEEYKETYRESATPVARVLAMGHFIFQKFFNHEELGDRLLATDNALLMEVNTWDDQLFGISTKNGRGDNGLGQTLMVTRRQLRIFRNARGA